MSNARLTITDILYQRQRQPEAKRGNEVARAKETTLRERLQIMLNDPMIQYTGLGFVEQLLEMGQKAGPEASLEQGYENSLSQPLRQLEIKALDLADRLALESRHTPESGTLGSHRVRMPVIREDSGQKAASSDQGRIRRPISREVKEPPLLCAAKEAGYLPRRAAPKYRTPKPQTGDGDSMPVTGVLSAQFESGPAGIAAIGHDKRSGTLYGKYQIACIPGTMKQFLNFLGQKRPDWEARLTAAGPANTGGRTGGMPSEWKRIAEENPEEFERIQDEFIYESHYMVARDAILKRTGTDMNQHSKAVQEVLWSTAVQHGPYGAASIFSKVISQAGDPGGQNFDKTVIEGVYNRRKDQFPSFSQAIQAAIKNRYVKEQELALTLLAQSEQSDSTEFVEKM